MTIPKYEPTASHSDNRLQNPSQGLGTKPRNTNASAKVFPLKRPRITAARRASWRLAEVIRLAIWRRAHGVIVDADTFAFALAATLASAPASVSIERRGGRVARWDGLDLLSLRKACEQAKLGQITDDELGTKMRAVAKWQAGQDGKTLRPDRLASMLCLSAIERAELQIRTICAVDESRVVRRERLRAEKLKADRERLRAKRAGKHMSRVLYLASVKADRSPWEIAGISRATYYRRRFQENKMFAPGCDCRGPARWWFLVGRARALAEFSRIVRTPMAATDWHLDDRSELALLATVARYAVSTIRSLADFEQDTRAAKPLMRVTATVSPELFARLDLLCGFVD